jgi:hypothetical protein
MLNDTDAGDLALRIEAEEKAGCIAARKVKLYQVECLRSRRRNGWCEFSRLCKIAQFGIASGR